MPSLLEAGTDADGDAIAAAEVARAPVKDRRSLSDCDAQSVRVCAHREIAETAGGVLPPRDVEPVIGVQVAGIQQVVMDERAHAGERSADAPGENVQLAERGQAVPALADAPKSPVVAQDADVLLRDARPDELASAHDPAVRLDESLVQGPQRRSQSTVGWRRLQQVSTTPEFEADATGESEATASSF